MSALVFAYPGNEALAKVLAAANGLSEGALTLRQFPDDETFVRIECDVKNRGTVIACTLDRPNPKILSLYFVARTLRDLGAKRIWLVTPYLPYMRQDKQFHAGEGVTANEFAAWLSSFLDGIITVDPHLHRIRSLSEIYAIRTHVVAAAPAISGWIAGNVTSPLLIGPDSESAQWVSEVARGANCPFVVLEKKRLDDRNVNVSVPQLADYRDRTPVLIDDIIATGHTMIAAARHLVHAGAPRPVCVGIHSVFAGQAYEELTDAGVARIVTCNTVSHPTNEIDVHPIIARDLTRIL